MEINILFWSSSPICLFLSILLYVSLQTITIFKTFLVIFLSLQILYPFKHQCVFLKWTSILCIIVWLIVSTSSGIMFVVNFRSDFLCSIAECSNNDKFKLLLWITCSSYNVLILFSILLAIKIYITLTEQNKLLSNVQTKSKYSSKNIVLVIKLAGPIIFKFPFRISLLLMQAMKLANVVFTNLCQSVFLFVLPVNIICSYVLLIYFKSIF